MGDMTPTGAKNEEIEAYCFRCRMRKTMDGATETRMRNGKRAFSGTCITCGTRMFKIVSLDPTESRPT
ncbi:MAG: DUF5679 domain-containing protein [Capsulimonadales bacterium]|nr:DUF5679 domain-containing protein [Capsulimonadales bacterium]